MIDLSKLTPPAPGSIPWRHSEMNRYDWSFYETARQAFAGDPEALAWWEANRVKPEDAK